MGTKKIPMRMCTGCREMKPKRDLIRIVRTPEGEIRLDTGRLGGRGAYLCRDPECLKKAKKTGELSKAFETAVPDDIFADIERQLSGIG